MLNSSSGCPGSVERGPEIALTQLLSGGGGGGSGGGGGGGGGLLRGIGRDFSVNEAAVTAGYADGSIVLRTSARANAAGAYTGGGTGNKSILGISALIGRPLADLVSFEYIWTLVTGSGGPHYLPPGPSNATIPYTNFLVDFAPASPTHNYRVLAVCDSGLGGVISPTIGTYTNDGNNNLTYAWNNTKSVLIVNSPNLFPAPGGVLPSATVGPNWTQNSYTFAALVAANPAAVLVEAFTSDGGLPAGAVTPPILLCSGDSGTVDKTGKRLTSIKLNGTELMR